MNRTLALLCIGLLMTLSAVSQTATQKRRKVSGPASADSRIPIDITNWSIQTGQAELTTYLGEPAIHILPNAKPLLVKTVSFTNGTIEYDFIPEDPRFAGMYFRRQDADESEYIYLRTAQVGNSAAMDAIQYAPYLKGVLIWDLMDQFQAPVPLFKKGEWNHIKLVVSGSQMRAYVNDMQRPVLEVPRLEGDTKQGGIAFEGAGYIKNLVVNPNQTEDLPAIEGYDPTRHDPRYVRAWQVSEPTPLPIGQEVLPAHFPKPETIWQPLFAERYGLVNLSRQFGISNERRLVWLRTKIKVNTAQKRRVSLGFSDDVWVFVNEEPVFTDKNTYRAPAMRKTPDGRISIENGSFDLPLKTGKNEVLVGLANNFFGWGLIARFDSVEGIEVLP
ncbi:MAG TPA: family 16 glycoside hydrolase [Spirosoma sp.]|jgi:hypothetical protein|nr:family 16 glycoside hydrolase [Spirosoma sp.]